MCLGLTHSYTSQPLFCLPGPFGVLTVSLPPPLCVFVQPVRLLAGSPADVPNPDLANFARLLQALRPVCLGLRLYLAVPRPHACLSSAVNPGLSSLALASPPFQPALYHVPLFCCHPKREILLLVPLLLTPIPNPLACCRCYIAHRPKLLPTCVFAHAPSRLPCQPLLTSLPRERESAATGAPLSAWLPCAPADRRHTDT